MDHQHQPTPAPAAHNTTTTTAPAGGRISRIISLVARPIQAVLGIIVLGMAAWFIHGAYTDEMGLALVCGLFSALLFAFALAAAFVPALKAKASIVSIVLAAADALLAILWLACMGSNAHLHSILNVRVSCRGTYDNGGLVNSKTCLLKRTNPNLVVGPAGRAIIIVVALISALEFLLFLGTTFLSVRAFLAARKANPTHSKEAEAGVPMTQQHPHNVGGAASVGAAAGAGAAAHHHQDPNAAFQHQQQQPYTQQPYAGAPAGQGYPPPPSVSPVSSPMSQTGYTPQQGYAPQPTYPQQGYAQQQPQQGYPIQHQEHPQPTTSPVQHGTVNGQQVYYPPPHQ